MSTTTMSIHRALAELKILDSRIKRAAEAEFVSIHIGDEAPKGFATTEDFNKKAAENFQSAQALIERRNKIKAAVTASNAATVVKIAGKKMTVAEAIDRRDTGIAYDQLLLNSLRAQLLKHEMLLQRETSAMEQRLEQRIQADLGSKERGKNADEVKAIEDQFLKRYKPSLVDPIKIQEKIEELLKSIEDFTTEVDYTLSESNTKTTVDIDGE